MENIIGIDLGGTSIKGGRIENGRIVKQSQADTQAVQGADVTLNVLKGVISELITDSTKAIGIGVPSVVDRKQGIVYNVQNISGWDEVHLKSILEKEFKIPVHIDNDANCFAYGERIFGKGRDILNFIGITLGTGLGAGIIQNGRLLCDANCGSGEFGEIPYQGMKLEDFCGSRFFIDENGADGFSTSLKARNGEQDAIKKFEEYGKHLAYLIKIIVLVLDPEAIIFGGSISQSFDLFEKTIKDNLGDFPYPKSIENLKIMVSEQKDCGILGAGSLCIDNTQTTL
jgi:glucokinase